MTLGVNPWTGARVTAAIAEQLVERRLGYPVEAVELRDTSRMLSDLSAGELDAVLEIWPSGLEPREQATIDEGAVASLGELGVVGKTGWYVPRYLIDEDPTLEDWEAYADPAVAARFATGETGAQGRLLGTDPGYEQFDQELIDGLELPFEVIYSGSEAATAAELARSTAAGRPILVYWWSPTAEVARFDLVNVRLPPPSADCLSAAAPGRPRTCDYPEDRLFKLAAPDLSDRAPDLERFLRAFSLTTEDQLTLIDGVDNDGRAIADVAAAWIDANPDRWERWFD